jgi:hypothetical protein
MAHDETLVIYTDGVTDTKGESERFGLPRLRRFLSGHVSRRWPGWWPAQVSMSSEVRIGLVDHLSSRWGTAREPDSDQRFCVWFELDVSDR